VVQFDRTVPPGGKGIIELKVDTKGLSGTIKYEAKVYSNDPKNSIVILTLKAYVKLSIQINPKRLNLNVNQGNIITQSVIITSNEERPLEIQPSQFKISERVTYDIEVMEQGRIFKVNFKYTPVEGDNFKGALILKTNYPEKPEISIPINVIFKKKTNSKDNR
jgi:hypothetical protein